MISGYIRTVNLPDAQETYSNYVGTVQGFGNTSKNSGMSRYLNFFSTRIMPNWEVIKKLSVEAWCGFQPLIRFYSSADTCTGIWEKITSASVEELAAETQVAVSC
jgi:hypothetical protein